MIERRDRYENQKSSFYLGMGMGIAAAASVAMMMAPKKQDPVKKAIRSTEQAVDSVSRKISG